MKKILIVDDEPDIRDTLKDLFEDEGFLVELAGNGSEALDALSQRGPHALVVLDLVMPQMDGCQLLAAMKADPQLASIPIILSTSYPGRAPTGVLIVRKPVDANVLINTAKGLC
jgi:CheY-like chemotaxis protein